MTELGRRKLTINERFALERLERFNCRMIVERVKVRPQHSVRRIFLRYPAGDMVRVHTNTWKSLFLKRLIIYKRSELKYPKTMVITDSGKEALKRGTCVR